VTEINDRIIIIIYNNTMEKVDNLLITLTENLKYLMDDKNVENSDLLENISSHSKDKVTSIFASNPLNELSGPNKSL
jgi:hypothetical protein